jgi:hypothetical protein
MVTIKVAVALASAVVRLPRGVLALSMDTANMARVKVHTVGHDRLLRFTGPLPKLSKTVSGSFGSEGVTYL